MFANRHVHDVIGAYVFDALTPEETRRVSDHLEQCAECREDMESQAAVISHIPDTGRSLTELDRERIRWSVLGTVHREQAVRKPFWGIVRGFSAAAAVACVFAAGIFVGARLVGPSERVSTLRQPVLSPKSDFAKPGGEAPIQARPAPKSRDNGEHIASLPKALPVSANRPRHEPHVLRGTKLAHKPRTEWQPTAVPSPARETTTAENSVSPHAENVAMAYPSVSSGGSAAVPTSDNDASPILLSMKGD
jgi:hypothetical protein